MRIADSSIIMDATRSFVKKDEVKESVQVWVDPQPDRRSDTVSISDKAKTIFEDLQAEVQDLETDSARPEVSLKRLIVEVLSGRRIKVMDPSELTGAAPPDVPAAAGEGQAAPQRVGWGMRADYEETHQEREDVSFLAAGVIKTADGQEIGFSLRLDMSREFATQRQIHIRAGDAALTDPLVINYGGNAAELSGGTFAFDIDSDGVEEDLPQLKAGRGFLALDTNGDGIINNGAELFGPRTGNGFEELAAYDADGNQWIDASDPIYDRLSILSVADGEARVQSLSSQEIGAIYLGNLAAPFDLRGTANELQGRISRTGLFVREDGSAGTVQHLDLVV